MLSEKDMSASWLFLLSVKWKWFVCTSPVAHHHHHHRHNQHHNATAHTNIYENMFCSSAPDRYSRSRIVTVWVLFLSAAAVELLHLSAGSRFIGRHHRARIVPMPSIILRVMCMRCSKKWIRRRRRRMEATIWGMVCAAAAAYIENVIYGTVRTLLA